MKIAGIILAAGASTRFGSTKPLAPFGHGTMLDAVVGTARDAGLQPVLVVAAGTLRLPHGVERVPNDQPELGMSRSLQLGLRASPAEAEAAVILLADQPTVSSTLLRRLVAARGERPIVATAARGLTAPPVLLERNAFGLADEATGDAGLRNLLRARPELVTRVEVARHAPDVDDPADLASLAEACPGCGARFGTTEAGESHPYIGASPACWAAFGELLAREFQNPTYGRMHRHTVDVYAAQHPGVDGRRQRQSVALHLVGMCHWLEHGLTGNRLNSLTGRLANEARDWPWLPAPAEYRLTVLDVLTAVSGDEHERLVRRWAESVWEAWSEHHELIRRWAAESLD